MPQITDNIRPELTRLLPSSLLTEVTCFVFYDNHPRDQKHVDIIIGTSDGEIKEFFKRGLVNTLTLPSRNKPEDIRIIRSGNCELFYLVAAGDELIIISRREQPIILRHVKNVEKYTIEDASCKGQAVLKVIIKDDAVPLIFDDNFVSLGDKAFLVNNLHADDSIPIFTELMRKLTETKYSVKCNESTLKEFLNLRQASAMSLYQKTHPNTKESIFNVESGKLDDVLTLKSRKPWVRMCNNKIVIVLIASYTHHSVPIEDIHVLLHDATQSSMVYTTKLYKTSNVSPYWKEKKIQTLQNNHNVAIVTVIDMEKSLTMMRKIELTGVIAYKRLDKEHVMPFDKVLLSSLDIMEEAFDALVDISDKMVLLAVVATTIKTELIFRHLRTEDEARLAIPDVFCKYLHMSKIDNTERTVIYRQSPYHVINGVMIVFPEDVSSDCNTIIVYTRSSSQIIALIHYIHDAIPHKIIITTPNIKISPKSEKQSRCDEETPKMLPKVNYDNYASALLAQTKMLLEYFDKCMAKMSESKDEEVRNKIGSEIDFFAGGLPNYMEFRKNMLDEALKGVKSLKINDKLASNISKTSSELDMVID